MGMNVDVVVVKVEYRTGYFYITMRRHLAPQTVNRIESILRMQPEIKTRGIIRSDRFFMNLKIGAVPKEKPRSKFRKGEVAFWIQSSALCLFLVDQEKVPSMNPLGEVVSFQEDEIRSLPLGTIMTISLAPDEEAETLLDELDDLIR